MSDPTPNAHITPGDSHASSHAHGSANFTDAEWANLQADDFAAGKAVVVLMLSIFLTGVVLYSIVAYSVIS